MSRLEGAFPLEKGPLFRPRASKSAPRAPKSAQERPRAPQERPKSAQERLKSAPRAHARSSIDNIHANFIYIKKARFQGQDHFQSQGRFYGQAHFQAQGWF